jgi:hypothetical protein
MATTVDRRTASAPGANFHPSPPNRVPARSARLVLGPEPGIVANRPAPHGVPRVVVPPLVSRRARSVDLGHETITTACQKSNEKNLFHTNQPVPVYLLAQVNAGSVDFPTYSNLR